MKSDGLSACFCSTLMLKIHMISKCHSSHGVDCVGGKNRKKRHFYMGKLFTCSKSMKSLSKIITHLSSKILIIFVNESNILLI